MTVHILTNWQLLFGHLLENLWKFKIISAKPFEKQTTLEAFKSMERKMKLATKPIILPHCHLYATFFPDDFKGKIVHITRDQR